MRSTTALNETTILNPENYTICTIDESDMPHIMDHVAIPYTRRAEAVIRELVANGIDSHTEAGVDKPVHVKLPTFAEPELVITDYGLGLSETDMINVFGKYSSSTKRDNDFTIGSKGIGSKVGFAVANNYRVRAIKDGIETLTVFTKLEGNVPAYQILYAKPTKENNTVEITIPVTNDLIPEYNQAAKRLAFWFPKGSVEFYSDEKQKYLHLTDVKRNRYGKYISTITSGSIMNSIREPETHIGMATRGTYVLMGGIAYDVPFDIGLKTRNSRYLTIIEIPIQPLDIAPSRESLRDTTFNKQLIKTLVDEQKAKHAANVKRKVKKVKFIADVKQILDHDKQSPFATIQRSNYHIQEAIAKMIENKEIPRKYRLQFLVYHNGNPKIDTFKKLFEIQKTLFENQYDIPDSLPDLYNEKIVLLEKANGASTTQRKYIKNWTRIKKLPKVNIVDSDQMIEISRAYDTDKLDIIAYDDMLNDLRRYGPLNPKKDTPTIDDDTDVFVFYGQYPGMLSNKRPTLSVIKEAMQKDIDKGKSIVLVIDTKPVDRTAKQSLINTIGSSMADDNDSTLWYLCPGNLSKKKVAQYFDTPFVLANDLINDYIESILTDTNETLIKSRIANSKYVNTYNYWRITHIRERFETYDDDLKARLQPIIEIYDDRKIIINIHKYRLIKNYLEETNNSKYDHFFNGRSCVDDYPVTKQFIDNMREWHDYPRILQATFEKDESSVVLAKTA